MSAHSKQMTDMQLKCINIGENMGMQEMWDCIQLALRDPNVMGKDTIGRGRMTKIFDRMSELIEEYHVAFTKDPEADYYQEKLDAQLREIWGDELKTFYERYPYVKKMGYDKPRKEWKA